MLQIYESDYRKKQERAETIGNPKLEREEIDMTIIQLTDEHVLLLKETTTRTVTKNKNKKEQQEH